MAIISLIKRWKNILSNSKSLGTYFTNNRNNNKSILFDKYKHLSNETTFKQQIRNHEFQVYSQNGEDGIILFIFDQIGVTTSTFIEFGIGDGRQCNSANLSINYNWKGLLIDADLSNIEKAMEFYKRFDCLPPRIQIKQLFITRENINECISTSGFTGIVDLLSIDIDGNDYWIWKAIEVVQPRVLVIEYNASLGPTKSLSVPYDPNFKKYDWHRNGWYHGASAHAINKLSESKGYSFIGCDSMGVNMFFVKNTELRGLIQKNNLVKGWYPIAKRNQQMSLNKQYNSLLDMNFEEI